MHSLAVRKYCKPSEYEVIERPIPTITSPDEVLIRVHAAGFMTGDSQVAGGMAKMAAKVEFPFPLGLTGAGIVTAIGTGVTTLKPGDAVYGTYFKHGTFPPPAPGFVSDYATCPVEFLIPKPAHLSFEEAAALAGTATTALQCVRRYFELTGQPPNSTLEGKTVFVPAALSACGSVFVQVLKNVYGAERVISTVSTAKVPLVEQLLPGIIDQVIDYQTQDVAREIGAGKVDFVLNTQWSTMVSSFPLVEPKGGAVVSIASVPSEKTVRKLMGDSRVPFFWLICWVANMAHWWYGWNLRGTNVKQDFVSGNMGDS